MAERAGPAAATEMARRLLFERAARRAGHRGVVGVDEAGRGPLAGPVVAAAVILAFGADPGEDPWWLKVDDSKRLTPRRREVLYRLIRARAAAVAVGAAGPREIERWNILQASLRAMARAVAKLGPRAEFLLVDGRDRVPVSLPQRPVVGGDARIPSISAASIVAKVTRDRLMRRYDRTYPQYGFALHKGYPTDAHRQALLRWGPCLIHRRTFQGVDASSQSALRREQGSPTPAPKRRTRSVDPTEGGR